MKRGRALKLGPSVGNSDTRTEVDERLFSSVPEVLCNQILAVWIAHAESDVSGSAERLRVPLILAGFCRTHSCDRRFIRLRRPHLHKDMIVWSAVGFDQFVATRLISTSHMNSHSVVSTAFKHVRVSAWLVGFATVAEDADQYQRCCFGGSHAQFDNIFPLLGRAIWDATQRTSNAASTGRTSFQCAERIPPSSSIPIPFLRELCRTCPSLQEEADRVSSFQFGLPACTCQSSAS